MNITHGQAQGQRPYQEDRYVIIEGVEGTLIAVFDGHGGSRTVQTLHDSLHELYARYQDREPLDLVKTLFTSLDERTKDFKEGSTASMALITKDEIVLAVLGDSPIQVLTNEGEFVMPEHNVRTNPHEVMAIHQRGGVIYNGYVFDPKIGYNTGVQMSRVFGDTELRNVTSQTPQTTVLKRENVISLLVASDGLTDPAHMTSIPPFLLTKHVTGEELVETYKNSFDNVTAVVVQF